MKPPSRRRRRGGFTLMEVLLVLVILVALASMAVLAYGPIQRKADAKNAKIQVATLTSAVDLWYQDFKSYPDPNEWTMLLTANDVPSGVNERNWNGPYLKTGVPPDPWGTPYLFKAPGNYNPRSFDIFSAGPDGTEGTEDDIGNWNVE
ncbi:MAG TPA: type II secretion system major pseudopilin GspG [Thermoguttaceae bacterium]|nr:type II secretion system major pseudopilin GspG [Thermoguttaceae bacterium]